MSTVVKENVLNKMIALLAKHQTLKYVHRDANASMITEERWTEIERQVDKLSWLYGGHFMTDDVDRQLIVACCKLFNANENNFKSKSRDRSLVYARAFYAKYLFMNGQSPDDIAYKINRDRTNFYNVMKVANNLIETENAMRDKFNSLLEKFKIPTLNDEV